MVSPDHENDDEPLTSSTVRDINLRTTVISLPGGPIAYLPNGSVWKNTIINQMNIPFPIRTIVQKQPNNPD